VLWSYSIGYLAPFAPALGPDGTIYICTTTELSAISSEGALKWQYETSLGDDVGPAIAPDGTVYTGGGGKSLAAVDPNGLLRWKVPIGSYLVSGPSIGVDGTIYVCSDNGNLSAIDSDGHFKWSYHTWLATTSPVIGPDGTVYLTSNDSSLCAVNTDGQLKWKFVAANYVAGEPSVGPDGSIYVGSDGTFYALNPDGTKRWETVTPSFVTSPVITSSGSIYYGCIHGLVALAPDGAQRWIFTPASGSTNNVPVFGQNGVIYTTSVNTVYGLRSADSPAAGSWSMLRKSARHTASMAPELPVANSTPTISAIADRALPEGFSPILISFGVQDAETPPGSLVVSAASSNPFLVPDSCLVIQNPGDTNRTLAISPVPANVGVTLISLTVTDSGGLSQSTGFSLSILADADHDGMPDSFEIQHAFNPNDPQDGLEDSDGDGISNALEYLAGTDPRNPTDYLGITEIAQAGADVIVGFSTVSGKRYRLEWSETGPHGPWAMVRSNILGTGAVVQVIDSGRAVRSMLCYRAVLEQ
jgi:outer membrane protein assembly factor BamB